MSNPIQAETDDRRVVAESKRIVVKMGTRVLSDSNGHLALSRLFEMVEVAARAQRQGREPLIVSSGAVGLGRDALGLKRAPADLPERRACAAIGQSRLMELYQAGFSRLGTLCAQVLLTQEDFQDRGRYLSLRHALNRLLKHKVIPVINENDVVSPDALALVGEYDRPVFGDNDMLSALLASKMGADLLILLTDVPGVYDRNPHEHPDAVLIGKVEDPDALEAEFGCSKSGMGRGGMQSKVLAASVASRSGCQVVIASGLEPGNLERVLLGQNLGTWLPARGQLPARKRWIAFAASVSGVLRLDEGAVKAVVGRGGSLLAAGLSAVDGTFKRGDTVELVGPADALVGRGLVEVDADTARQWMQGRAPAGVRTLIRRENMVLESQDEEEAGGFR